jgi:glutathione S-transferase
VKLRWAPGSPFVRKVMVTAIETGLDRRIEKLETDYAAPDDAFVSDNPLGKIPALILDDGAVLADSPVICAYLDSLHDGVKLIPADGNARWQALHLEGLADGLCESAIGVMRENVRPDDRQWDSFRDRQWSKVERTMGWLDSHADILDGPVTIGHVALGCAIGWTVFRLGDRLGDWHTRWPHVAAWYTAFEQRPSMKATRPR